ncbi:MAG: class I SAM-dependent methyltransferase [Methanotrichaceae archaeon]
MTIRDQLFEAIADHLASLSQLGRVLDVGTGKGLLPVKIAQRNQLLEVYGVDVSEKAIDAARKNSLALGLKNPPQFKIGDVSNLPFEDNYFDAVVATFSLHHWPKPVSGLNEIYRVLKPGGEALIYDHSRNPSAAAKEQMRKKYGWLLSSYALLHLKFVSSCLTEDDAQVLLNDTALKFQEKELKQHGIFLLLRLKKAENWPEGWLEARDYLFRDG